MSSPKISVVIDNYNYGRYLEQAIRGVLDQDYPGEVECVVSDDGSTDESRDIIASFGDKVVGVLRENKGQATAFNNGFEAATGEIVCMLDSDDYWVPRKLKTIAERFEDPEVGIVQHHLRDVDVKGEPLPQPFPEWPAEYTIDDFLDQRCHFTATSGLAFRKSILDKVLPLPTDVFYYLDDLLFVKAMFLSKAANVPEILGFHRIHDANFCAGGYWNPKKLEFDIKMREVFNREIAPWMDRHKKWFTERYRVWEDMEYYRRRILLHMFKGERGKAFDEWCGLLGKYWTTRFGLFRGLTCMLALVSPKLYLEFYEAYRGRGIAHLRYRLFPE